MKYVAPIAELMEVEAVSVILASTTTTENACQLLDPDCGSQLPPEEEE